MPTKSPLAGGRKARPTQRHRPAIWENMLGTVYAMDDAGLVRYFDYDYEGARAFAGADEPERDPRTARAARSHSGTGPRKGQLVLYVRRPA